MNAVSGIASDPIATFVPWATPEERQQRQRLHKAQIIASAKALAATSSQARDIFWIVNRTAGEWVFAPASREDLQDIADCLVQLFMAASTFERVEGGAQ